MTSCEEYIKDNEGNRVKNPFCNTDCAEFTTIRNRLMTENHKSPDAEITRMFENQEARKGFLGEVTHAIRWHEIDRALKVPHGDTEGEKDLFGHARL